MIKQELTYRTSFSPFAGEMNDDDLDFVISARIDYDEKGNVIVNETFDENGEMVQRMLYSYDNQGRVISETHLYVEDEIEERREVAYDAAGRISHEKRYYGEGGWDTTTYEYNSNGKLIRKVVRDDDDEISDDAHYEWRGDLMLSEIVYEEDGSVRESVKQEFDEEGLLYRRYEYRAIDVFPLRIDFEYDENGRRSVAKHYNDDGKLLSRILLKYNDKGVLVQSREETTVSTRIVQYEFDAADNPIKDIETDLAGNVLSSVERRFNEAGLQLRTEVRLNQPGRQQNYILKFEYTHY